MGFCWDSKKNSLEINMDHNISCVFLLGFYRGLQKKTGILLGLQMTTKKEVGILKGY